MSIISKEMITVSFPSLFIQFYVKGSCPAGLWGKGQFAWTHFLEQKKRLSLLMWSKNCLRDP